MGYIIIILLIIIILIFVAPVVLSIIGLLIAGIIGAIINYWWVFLIAIVFAIGLPSILKSVLNSIEKGAKFSNKKKYIIYSTSTILLLTIVFGILVNNKTILTYPISCEYDPELINRANAKLFNDRGDEINNIVPLGKFSFGMTKDEILNYVRMNNISKEIFFDNYTYSNINISDSSYELPVKYFFDTNNKLREVEFELGSNHIQQVENLLGNKYILEESFESKTTWFNGNQKITLFGRSYNEKFNIHFVDYNYHGMLNSTPIYSPLKKLREIELKKQKSGLKEKKNTFMGFQLGMTSKEVELKKKELISNLIEEDNFTEYFADKKLFGLKKFKFYINERCWVNIENIKFLFEDDKLYKLDVDFLPNNDSINNKFLEMYLKKYGDFSIKMKNANSNTQYLWIKDGVEVAYSWGTLSYVDIYTQNQKQIALQKNINEKRQQVAKIKKMNEIKKMKIIELEKIAKKEKEIKLKNQKNNI